MRRFFHMTRKMSNHFYTAGPWTCRVPGIPTGPFNYIISLFHRDIFLILAVRLIGNSSCKPSLLQQRIKIFMHSFSVFVSERFGYFKNTLRCDTNLKDSILYHCISGQFNLWIILWNNLWNSSR